MRQFFQVIANLTRPRGQRIAAIAQPFQPGASSTGLGLFVSRAIIRTFGGELHQTQQPGECSFIVELPGAVVNQRVEQ